MNAVARAAYEETTFTRGVSLSLNLPELKILVLIFLMLVSALGVVYVKDLNRRLFINYHQLVAETEQLKTSSTKLLLEQSAWGSQSRVQVVAQQQLEMKIPPSTEVLMIKV